MRARRPSPVALAALVLSVLAVLASASAWAVERPGRIVSANLCADRLVLALAMP
ncbi:MAG: hypothetical protein ACKOUS_10155 [Alphaproteobacteria bacterium]